MRIRIATWNLERPNRNRPDKIAALRERMRELAADIWILTETNAEAIPGDGFLGAASSPINNALVHSPGENRTTVWSRFPISSLVETHDRETAVCIDISTPLGPTLVYGTVLPYHAAGTKYPYRSGGNDVAGQRQWDLHYDCISQHEQNWRRLRSKYPDHLFFVGGDLNQSRDGRLWNGQQWYGTDKGRRQLTEALHAVGLACVTEEDLVASGKLQTRSSIDHICLDASLASRVTHVGAWEAGCLPDGTRLSDHNGVYVDIQGS